MLNEGQSVSFSLQLLLAASASLYGLLSLALLYVHVKIASSRLMFLSSIAYMILSFRFANLLAVRMEIISFSSILWDMTTVLPALLVFLAVYDRFEKKIDNVDISLFAGSYSIFALVLYFIFQNQPVSFTPMITAGGFNIITAILVLRWKETNASLRFIQRVMAFALLLHGLHRLNYPFVANMAGFIGPGMALGLFLGVVFALTLMFRSMILVSEDSKRETLYRQEIYEAAPVGLLVLNRQSFRFEMINKGGISILGYSLPELNQIELPNGLLHPDDIMMWRDLVTRNQHEDQNKLMNVRVRHKLGHFIQLQVERKTFKFNTKKEAVKVVYGFQDVTKIASLYLKLRQTERILLHSNFVAFRCRFDRPWEIEFVSDNVHQIGWDLTDFSVRLTPFSAVMQPFEIHRFAKFLNDAVNARMPQFSIELQGRTSRGENRWFDITGYPEFSLGEGRGSFECIIYDVTDKKSASRTLEMREALLREVFENAAFGIAVVELNSAVIQVSNTKFADMMGVSVFQVEGTKIDSYLSENSDALSNHLSSLADNSAGFQSRITVRTRNRAAVETWCRVYISKLPGIASDAPRAVLLLQDISTEKRVSDELEETFQRMPSALLIFEIDIVGRPLLSEINEAGVRLFEIEEMASIGKNISEIEFFGSLQFAEILKDTFKELSNQSTGEFREVSLDVHGIKKHLSIIAFRKRNGKIGLLAEDITQNRSLQRELLAVADRERIKIGQNLHDGLGQQLVGISMFLNSLMSKVVKNGYDSRIGADIKNLIDLVNETNLKMRSFARGLAPLSLQNAEIAEVIAQSLIDAERVLGLNTKFINKAGVIKLTEEHANHLFHILQEFMTNSVKHGGALHIYCELSFVTGRLNLRLKDDGKKKPEPEGKGLGIRTMKYRASQIGAEIDLQISEQGSELKLAYASSLELISEMEA